MLPNGEYVAGGFATFFVELKDDEGGEWTLGAVDAKVAPVKPLR